MKTILDGNSSRVLLKIIYFVFLRFSESLFALIHSVSLSNSKLTVFIRVLGLSCEKKTLESSAKSMKERMSDDLQKSLIYSINNSGPKRLPWGTPQLNIF